MSIVTVIACLISVLIIPRNSPRLWKKHKQGISSIYIQLQLQLQSGYLVTSESRHLTKERNETKRNIKTKKQNKKQSTYIERKSTSTSTLYDDPSL